MYSVPESMNALATLAVFLSLLTDETWKAKDIDKIVVIKVILKITGNFVLVAIHYRDSGQGEQFSINIFQVIYFTILARPQVGKLVVACRWSAVYSTEP